MLRQLLASDAGLYVIDAREPVLAKYRDELAVLASCGKPLLPVFALCTAPNSASPSGVTRWRASACMRWYVSTAWLRPIDQEQRAL